MEEMKKRWNIHQIFCDWNRNRVYGNKVCDMNCENVFESVLGSQIDLAVSKERSRIVERVMKDAEEKHSGHEDWEYGDCDCDSLYNYKDIINLINTK